ncbi:MAG: hypothetical protein HYX76_02415 [Acidobacteria bacterium]|nr:hypothetical protein [Acidobacteriota bacterium]
MRLAERPGFGPVRLQAKRALKKKVIMRKSTSFRFSGGFPSLALVATALVAGLSVSTVSPPLHGTTTAGIVEGIETRLVDFFPKTTNGENGIFLQYRAADGSYANLPNARDYEFRIPRLNQWDLPAILVNDFVYNDVFAHPTALNQCNIEADAVIRVSLNADFGVVEVSGRAWVGSEAIVRHYIYKGAGNYNAPIWQTWSPDERFGLVIPYAAGEELFFATDSGDDDINDWAHWDIRSG